MAAQRTPRPYRQVKRAAAVEATRDRIVAAAFSLHATVGPSRTTISAIADRAGVQRHTVYAHFPTIDDLYEACTAHGIAALGMPTPAPWSAIDDPADRLRRALADLIAWYRANGSVLATLLLDVDPSAAPPLTPDPFTVRMTELRAAIVAGWRVPKRRRLAFDAVVDHALAFETWRSLSTGGLPDRAIVDVLVALVTGVADGSLP
jgi:AcrR family transcriptional regulator